MCFMNTESSKKASVQTLASNPDMFKLNKQSIVMVWVFGYCFFFPVLFLFFFPLTSQWLWLVFPLSEAAAERHLSLINHYQPSQ